VRKANALLERGIEAHPHDWRNRFYLGFNHFYYLQEPIEAADALEGAIALPRAPLYLHRLVARLKSAEAGLEVAEAFLRELLRNELDPKAQAQFEEALDEIATERLARVLDAARSEYVERHGRDVASVEDLVAGPDPILRALPPEPHGGGWAVDPTTGQIVSAVVGHRYEPKLDPVNRERAERWRAQREEERASDGAPVPEEGREG
jgi:tetratricopeptide (TPR) repeat protein